MTTNQQPRLQASIGLTALVGLLAMTDLLIEATYTGIARVRDTGLASLVIEFAANFDSNFARLLPAFINHSFAFGAHPLAPHLSLVIVCNILVFGCFYMISSVLFQALPKAVPWTRSKSRRVPAVLLLSLPVLPVGVDCYRFVIVELEIWMGHGLRWSVILPLLIIPNFLLATILYLHRRGAIERLFRFLCLPGSVALFFLVTASWINFASQQDVPTTFVPKRPNILLVSIDSLRSDHLGCYGYAEDTSPTIDQLAEQGVLFETAVSPTSWTLPAHLTLLTGLPPEGHGVIRDGMRLNSEVNTLSEVLRDAGYFTLGVVSGPYLDASYGFYQGFDMYDDFSSMPDRANMGHEVTSPSFFKTTEKWLRSWYRRERERPLFAFLHMWDVHMDYNPPSPYNAMFDPDYAGDITSKNFHLSKRIHPQMDPRDLKHIIALYDGEIRYTDYYLHKTLRVLEDLGELDNTIIAVTADHGDEFFEHGDKGHRKTLYDEVILVPLVVRFPETIPAGRRVKQQVRLMDVAPTLLSLAGVAPPPDFATSGTGAKHTAQDLTPLILGKNASHQQPLVAFGDLHGELGYIRTQAMKMIGNLKEHDKDEVYDLVNDPTEEVNLASRRNAATNALREALRVWREAHAEHDAMAESLAISADQLKVLRSLGYVQ